MLGSETTAGAARRHAEELLQKRHGERVRGRK
jgi:hypothetical protein